MSDLTATPGGLPGAPPVLPEVGPVGVSPFKASVQRFARNHLAVVSCVVLLIILLACYVGPYFFPFTSEDADFENISAPLDLFTAHPFGTDDLGRDLLLRTLDGGQVSLALGFFGALVSVLISVLYGSVAGYVGGWLDDGVNPRLSGSGLLVSQTPPPGSVVDKGQELLLVFEPAS
jgi:oligopeptide transport system permease protein